MLTSRCDANTASSSGRRHFVEYTQGLKGWPPRVEGRVGAAPLRPLEKIAARRLVLCVALGSCADEEITT